MALGSGVVIESGSSCIGSLAEDIKPSHEPDFFKGGFGGYAQSALNNLSVTAVRLHPMQPSPSLRIINPERRFR